MSAGQLNRHLSPGTLLDHWNSGVPVRIPVAGEPHLALLINPLKSCLTLRTPVAAQATPRANALANIRVEVSVDNGVRYLDISTTDDRLIIEGYAMLSAIADRIQLDGADPLRALEETLATWRSILATRLRMTAEAEVGLVGELMVLEALIGGGGSMSAASWRGGDAEEHDFGLPDVDAEVKTTAGERRQHWIHGLGQLVPTGKTPLWLLSLQITRAGAGDGRTLPELIDELSALVTVGERNRFERVLHQLGWQEDQRDLFPERWRLRSIPAAFRVDHTFPRLTAADLTRASVDVSAIRQVSYEIDLTERSPSKDPPASLTKTLAEMETNLG
jgi:hypothetical protein